MNNRASKWLLRHLYRSNPIQFAEVEIEETFIHNIPGQATDDSLAFLRKNRKQLEPWLVHQAYEFQRRFVSVNKTNGDLWLGALWIIKALFHVTHMAPIISPDEIPMSEMPIRNEKKEHTVDIDAWQEAMRKKVDKDI